MSNQSSRCSSRKKAFEDLVILINFDVTFIRNSRLGIPSAGLCGRKCPEKNFGLAVSKIVVRNTKETFRKPVAWNGKYSVELSVPPTWWHCFSV